MSLHFVKKSPIFEVSSTESTGRHICTHTFLSMRALDGENSAFAALPPKEFRICRIDAEFFRHRFLLAERIGDRSIYFALGSATHAGAVRVGREQGRFERHEA